jgi:hypothetical protein
MTQVATQGMAGGWGVAHISAKRNPCIGTLPPRRFTLDPLSWDSGELGIVCCAVWNRQSLGVMGIFNS